MSRPSVLLLCHMQRGRAIAQAVSRWRPTAAARVQSRVWSSAICGGQSGAQAVSRTWKDSVREAGFLDFVR
jgi:LPS sulfotransferase NodH